MQTDQDQGATNIGIDLVNLDVWYPQVKQK